MPAGPKLSRFATVIANPKADRGRVAAELGAVPEALGRLGFDHRIDLTDGPGGALRLAREALGRGERFLVAVGGDRTVNEVVGAMLENGSPAGAEAVLAVVSARSENDVVRTFGLPEDPAEALERFAVGRVFAIDAGKVTFQGPGGERTRFFLNVAQVGLGGAAAAASARLPRALGRGRRFLG